MTIQSKGILINAGLGCLLFLTTATGSVYAQQSVDELEKLIQQQKEALAEVEANRSATEAQAQQAQDALAEEEKRKAKIEEEFDTLCKEQEALKPGSYDDCMASM